MRIKKSYILIFLSFLEAGNRSVLDSGASWLLETSNSDKCIISSLVETTERLQCKNDARTKSMIG